MALSNAGVSPACIGLYAGRDGSNNYFILAIAQGAGLYRATCPHASDPTVRTNWTWTAPVADEGGAPSMVTLTATNTAALTTTVSFPLAVSGVVPTATITTDPPSLPRGAR